MTEFVDLHEAVAKHVRAGDSLHVILGHSRWSALLREVTRQHWGKKSGFTLQMASLSSLGAVLFESGSVDHVVTVYSGDSFPSFTPNPVFQRAYASGEVTVENWSFLTYVQRLRAAAFGLPATVTGSVVGSTMEEQDAFTTVEVNGEEVCLVAPLVPDVAIVHAAVADRAGNLALSPPMFEGAHGAFAARRGVLATVERVVDDLRPWSTMVRIPAHRVLAVVEAPFGAHPGGVFAGPSGSRLPVDGYDEDIPFWIEVRDASRSADFHQWIRTWILEPQTHQDYLELLGAGRLRSLTRVHEKPRAGDEQPMPSNAERAATWFADLLVERIRATGAHSVLAGAGLANLAAWVGADRSREAGAPTRLVAELGLWDYEPQPGDPLIFSFANFPTAAMLGDSESTLGTLVCGPGTAAIACVGAAQIDRNANINTTLIPGGPHLVGSGGGNDVVTRADETLVVTTMSPGRFIEACDYVTSPGDRVRAVVTDKGVLTRIDGELALTAVPAEAGTLADAVADVRSSCGWDLRISETLAQLRPVTDEDLARLRTYDPTRIFLGGKKPPLTRVQETHA